MIITRKLQHFLSPRLRGLGIWNAYFLFKFGLFYLSYMILYKF